MDEIKRRPSPWSGRMAQRTYVATLLWVAGTVLLFITSEPEAAGWFRFRSDAPGLILALASAVGGWNFAPKALRSIRRARLDMNFLMTVAILGALTIGEPVEAAAIASLFSLAELLESAAVYRARQSVEELVRLTPDSARRLTTEGAEESVRADSLKAGDTIAIRPGERIAVDGTVRKGASSVDESTITGESVPVHKEPGDSVYAGTIVVEGHLTVESTRDAGDTALDRIVSLVRQAQSRKSSSERFIDTFARYYTPAVVVAAVITMTAPPWLFGQSGVEWFTRGLTLLVVACPCALVIATPVTVVSAITSATRHGVLIKGGEHLETLGMSCAFAFDKTGTLTSGRMQVASVIPFDGQTEEEVLRLAAQLEGMSGHPIAAAVQTAASDRGIAYQGEVTDFASTAGKGIEGRISGTRVRVGSPSFFPDHELPPPVAEVQARGETAIVVQRNGSLAGVIGIADRLRDNSSRVLDRLRQLGTHEIIMLTGDNSVVARAIASNLNVDSVLSDLLPASKAQAIRELKSKHGYVAMVGDGVNDAPALAEADVGIAMGAIGSPAAIETADVALMGDDLDRLPYLVGLSRRARRTIRLNVGLALGLKLLLVIGAIGGVVSLLIAVLVGDLGASLAVTLNASRLSRYREPTLA